MRAVVVTLVEVLFRLLFTYDCVGEENVPLSGPAVVASNHPSYLDPILLSLQVPRPIHFMAWDGLFRVPLLGALMRVFGAFPVDVRPGKGREAYERARDLVRAGNVVGIFPEGKRSRSGWMEKSLREGAARLALETGAPLVPATIAGAFRAWPHQRALPRPVHVRVRYHEPIDPRPYQAMPEGEAIPALATELRRRVERALLPAVKADLRMEVAYAGPAPGPRAFEAIPLAALAAAGALLEKNALAAWPAALALAYLLADARFIPQSRLAKRARNVLALAVVMVWAPLVVRAAGGFDVPAQGALLALLLGALFPQLYDRQVNAVGFVRGLIVAVALEMAALWVAPAPVGPHLALPVFAAAHAWDRRTVFWRYAVAILVAYAVVVPLALRGLGPRAAAVHLAAGLLAWAVTRVWPFRVRRRRTSGDAVAVAGR